MSISTRQDLATYCLRRLGGGVVNIEISNDQVDDCINEAIKYYQEYHYDGITRDYIIRKISATVISVSSVVGFSTTSLIQCATKGITAPVTAVDELTNTITIDRTNAPFGVNFAVGDEISLVLDPLVTQTIIAVTLGDCDNRYIAVDDAILGVIKILNLTSVLSSGDYMFNAQYQIMLSEMKNLTSGQTNYLYSTLSYISHLDFLLRKERDFRFNRRMNKLFLDIAWGTDIKIGDYVVAEVYRALDDTTYPKIMNDRWLIEYTTALLKKDWGTNLSKYSGMSLPGGLQYDGQRIYKEAVDAIETLREEAINSSAPLEFMIG